MEKLNFNINFLPEKFLKSMFFNVTKLNFFSNAKYSCNRQYADWPPSGKGRLILPHQTFILNVLFGIFSDVTFLIKKSYSLQFICQIFLK